MKYNTKIYSKEIYYEIGSQIEDQIGAVPVRKDTLEEAKEYVKEQVNRKENDGYDEYWNNQCYLINKIIKIKEFCGSYSKEDFE
ncbi:hypothetical protein [uncultured Clostridium sp.]|uniref:hypothetical protein n=1 Tax=uncultured Clostridium sp. TaxID=59620 RepID=UPI00262A8B92|nr:hypothetical protein [uncultured Clostridium sp.]